MRRKTTAVHVPSLIRFITKATIAFLLPGAAATGCCEKLFFISDAQLPMTVEKMYLHADRNSEARDSLFTDLIRQHPTTVFMLGDLVSSGSSEKAWRPIDAFCQSLQRQNASCFAIPGNHEYYWTAKAGLKKFLQRFPERWLHGYCVTVDSMAVVLVNSNFKELGSDAVAKQQSCYRAIMDSLDAAPAIKTIIVCTHHAPFTNSEIVGPSAEVDASIVPRFEKSGKTRLFVSGHSHNLEFFKDSRDKRFAVIGGGGGIRQPLFPPEKRKYADLIRQEDKPLYFYFVVERNGKILKLSARGLNKDFKMIELSIGEIKLD